MRHSEESMSIRVKQLDFSDCGAACLASIVLHHQLNFDITQIRALASTNGKRISIKKLVEVAQKIGFEANGVHSRFDELFNIPLPAIAYLIVGEILQHYVVIYKVTDRAVQIMDPINGQIHFKTHEEFKKDWAGILVVMQLAEASKLGLAVDSFPKHIL